MSPESLVLKPTWNWKLKKKKLMTNNEWKKLVLFLCWIFFLTVFTHHTISALTRKEKKNGRCVCSLSTEKIFCYEICFSFFLSSRWWTAWMLAKLPAVAALVAEDKGRHRLVGWPGLNLVIGTVPLVALPALKQGRLCSLKKKKAIVEDFKFFLNNFNRFFTPYSKHM